MFEDFLKKLKNIFTSRITILGIIIAIMFCTLIFQTFSLQNNEDNIVNTNEEYKYTTNRDIKSTRGNIYDVNGNLLAYNVLSYYVIIEDSGLLTTNVQKNTMLYKLVKIFQANNTDIEIEFGISIDDDGNLYFNVSDSALLRFKKNAYGRKSTTDLSEEELAATAEEVFNFLRYGNSTAAMFQISDEYSIEDALKIAAFRYNFFSSQSGTQFTVATDINDGLIIAIKEYNAELPGVQVVEKTSRVYNDSIYFAHIIGYTGTINSTELENLNNEIISNNNLEADELSDIDNIYKLYTSTDAVGKTGIEKSMETYLAGIKGTQTITTNSTGKVLDVEVVKEPTAGDDIYLTIDRELQICCYHILERNLAAILLDRMTDKMDYGTKGESASDIRVPVYEVYYKLLENKIIDVGQFDDDDATVLEKKVYSYYQIKESQIINSLDQVLDVDSEIISNTVDEELQSYLSFFYGSAINLGLIVSEKIDTTDDIYKQYNNNEISMSSFIKYAINNKWINLNLLGIKNEYYDTDEIYSMFMEYMINSIRKDDDFINMIYHTLIFEYILPGKEICLLLYDQNVIEYNEIDESQLKNDRITAYEFIRKRIENIEITPGQIGLAPCSGSIVITDVNTGNVRAMVTYPSYDNNMLANKIVWDYYSKLLINSSYPLINRPTTQTTTTGSTFKPLSALIGLSEGVISTYTKIMDLGRFETEPSYMYPRCWKYPGTHGLLDLTGAIRNSCNYFFYEVGYRLTETASGDHIDSLGISKIQLYAAMFGLSEKSGVEIAETAPKISDSDAVRTAIGYGHSFTPVQISRYISTVANEGTCYYLTILDSIREQDGDVILQNEPKVYNEITFISDSEWDAVKLGMYQVVNTSTNSLDTLYKSLGVEVAGKTGTAQINASTPNNALFVSFAPYANPEISVTVVLPNGYSSANAAHITREIYGLYFNNENKAALLNGDVKAGTATSITITD